MKILFTGGGTGGHIFPLIAVARAIQRDSTIHQLMFAGACRGYEQVFEENNIPCHNIITGKIRRHFSLWHIIDIPLVFVGIVQSCFFVLWYRPDIVFSKGGYGAFPVVLMSWVFRGKIVSHDSDSVVGFTNALLFKLSDDVLMSFPRDNNDTRSVGNPVRDLRGAGDKDIFKDENPVLFFIGGSQGAVQINTLLFSLLDGLLETYNVIHQAGVNNTQDADEKKKLLPDTKRERYQWYGFMDEDQMRSAYSVCDVVISRAGASALFEIALVGKVSIIIPLDSAAADHQRANAKVYEKSGACIVIDPKKVTPEILLQEIQGLMSDKNKKKNMEQSATRFSKPRATEDIAKIILTYEKTP